MKQINQMEPRIGEEEKRAMMEYLDSGGWLTEFKRTKEFRSCPNCAENYIYPAFQ